jgi:2-hydroxychromene-2-carboxylate isomerase
MKKIDFYFDFASPNAYLSHKVMQTIKEKHQVDLNYVPVLLGGIFKATNNKPPYGAILWCYEQKRISIDRNATIY